MPSNYAATGRYTNLIVVTQDSDETTWEMVPAYQVADYIRESKTFDEYQVIGIYELELTRTGGAVAPVHYELMPDGPTRFARRLVIHPDQQDPIEFTFSVDPDQ